MSFESLGLLPELLRAVREQGYEIPTPVQAQAIPVVLDGRDVMAGAQTGTGKTAAFTLPLLQRLAPQANTSASPARHPVRALILTPTRELALQVEESVRTYGKYLSIRSTVVFGGVNINPQIQALRKGAEILVATPGRLLDHYQQGTVDFSHLEILVLDEADRMLDMGFIRDIRKILALLPSGRQNILCSATFDGEIRKLAEGLLKTPVSVDVAPRNAAAKSVKQVVLQVDRERKRHLLAHLIKSRKMAQVLVFTRTKHGANRLSEQLEKDGISAMAIHGSKSQPQRIKALADFKQGGIQVLVATDIASRGLDIDQLPHVVNYELPYVGRGLRAPDRPHGPRRHGGRGPEPGVRGRAEAPQGHRAPPQARPAEGGRPGVRAGSFHQGPAHRAGPPFHRGAEPPAQVRGLHLGRPAGPPVARAARPRGNAEQIVRRLSPDRATAPEGAVLFQSPRSTGRSGVPSWTLGFIQMPSKRPQRELKPGRRRPFVSRSLRSVSRSCWETLVWRVRTTPSRRSNVMDSAGVRALMWAIQACPSEDQRTGV